MQEKLSEMIRRTCQHHPDLVELLGKAEALEQEVAERRGELDNLETELKAVKVSEEMESAEADKWATRAHAAEQKLNPMRNL